MNNNNVNGDDWVNKPTDRFVLRWIKRTISARITPKLWKYSWLKPWMITLASAFSGIIGGAVFALGFGFIAGLFAGMSQVLDGVDGQYARTTGSATRAGALFDSVLDRFSDGAMMIGMVIYLVRIPVSQPLWLILLLGAFAFLGSNGVSYSSARAEALGIDPGKPTLASKGTRSAVMVICALGTVFWPPLPLIALIYLVIHPNGILIWRLVRAYRSERE
ncbi:MAG: CDP-alcohol phosphatidyltransferase family protein [Deltaproteobacteria bacterium]|nr:CDP-alcohol phosphatidyltransferase family protein [Deltaproteobacteria bacterium]